MAAALIALAIPVLIILFLSCLVARSVRRNGFWLGRQGSSALRWLACTVCEGWGEVMLDGTVIPKKHRGYGKDESGGFVQGGMANARLCRDCQGMGGVWMDSEGPRGMRLPPS